MTVPGCGDTLVTRTRGQIVVSWQDELDREYRDVLYPASPPRTVQKVLFALLNPVARLLGYGADYSYPRLALEK